MKKITKKLTRFKQWILSIVRRSYSFEDMERAYEEGIHEGTLRQMYKDRNSDEFIHSDLDYYLKGWD